MFNYVTPETVVELNRRCLEHESGTGLHALIHPGLLESALKNPHQTSGGMLLVPDPVDRIVLSYERIIRNHPFMDGNKRTATLTLLLLLEVNGLELRASTDELVDIAVAVARDQIDFPALLEWFKYRLTHYERPIVRSSIPSTSEDV